MCVDHLTSVSVNLENLELEEWWFGFKLNLIDPQPTPKNVDQFKKRSKVTKNCQCSTFNEVEYKSLIHSVEVSLGSSVTW